MPELRRAFEWRRVYVPHQERIMSAEADKLFSKLSTALNPVRGATPDSLTEKEICLPDDCGPNGDGQHSPEAQPVANRPPDIRSVQNFRDLPTAPAT
jgi:hypothetical protein